MAAYAPPQAGEVKQAPPGARRSHVLDSRKRAWSFRRTACTAADDTRADTNAGAMVAGGRRGTARRVGCFRSCTAAGFLTVLWAVDLVDPEGLDNIWRCRFRPRYLSAILIPFILFELPWQYQPASQARPAFAGPAAV